MITNTSYALARAQLFMLGGWQPLLARVYIARLGRKLVRVSRFSVIGYK